MGLWRASVFFALVAVVGCGGDDGTPVLDTGTVLMDTGTLVDTSTPSDASVDTAPPDPPVDTGPPPATCDDDDYGDTCEAATDLGVLMEGETMSPLPGLLPEDGDVDWYRIGFPESPEMGTPGIGVPRIEITVNEGDAFRFEVLDSCTTTLACLDDVIATDLDRWSFVDDQAMGGDEQWSTRDVPWPESVLIRVYRPDRPADCRRYRLGISR